MILFGILEDFTIYFVSTVLFKSCFNCYIKDFGYPFGFYQNLFSNSEPIWFNLYYRIAPIFGSTQTYNVYILISLLLLLTVSFVIFYSYIGDSYISIILSILLLLSPFISYQYRSHPQLVAFWLLLVFVFVFVRNIFNKNNYYSFVAGVILGFTILISNYLGYFGILFILIYLLSSLFLLIIVKQYNNIFMILKSFVITITTALFLTILCLPIHLKTYFPNIFGFLPINIQGNVTKINWQINPHENTSLESKKPPLSRDLDDFVNFTSRPWYYLLPSVDNPFFGKVSQNVIFFLQNNWGYFLTQNYFKSEHSASYLGWVNLFFAIIGLRYIILKNKEQLSKEPKRWNTYLDMICLGITALILIVFTMPPYITISGIKFYLPSYLLWKTFPMFRVLSRLGILILFITLLFTSFGYKFTLEKIKSKFGIKNIAYLFLLPFFIISFMEFYIPVKFTYIGKLPQVFEYIKNNTSKDSVITIYPYSETDYAFFWMKDYNRALINPRGYVNRENNFDSELYTKNLNTCEGLLEAYNLGADYLVSIGQTEPVFNESKLLKKVQNFDLTSNSSVVNMFFTIEDASYNKKTVVYEFNKKIDYEIEKDLCLRKQDLKYVK